MAVKKKDHEKLDDNTIQYVIDKLEQGCTKKEACEILNISYNTKRLNTIIEEYKKRREYAETRIAQNKGKRASPQEIKEVIEGLLMGESTSSIAKRLFRSSTFVNSIASRVGIPRKRTGSEKTKIDLLPDACVKESFEPGEMVWVSKYNAPGIIVKEIVGMYEDRYKSKAYWVTVIGDRPDSENSFFPHVDKADFKAACPAYDLGSLEHLNQYGVDWKYVV